MATKPSTNTGQQLLEGLLTGAAGVMRGGPTSTQVRGANSFMTNFHYMQEDARRRTASQYCPSLGVNGLAETARRDYQA
jgi:hypothetical protein